MEEAMTRAEKHYRNKDKTWYISKEGIPFSIAWGKTRKLSVFINQNGYRSCRTRIGSEAIHRLLWIYFNGVIPKGLTINHINGNKLDNRLENLELATHAENTKHAWKNGLNKAGLGNSANSSKLTEKQVLKIRKLYSTGNYSYTELGGIYKVDQSQIGNIINRKQWSHI